MTPEARHTQVGVQGLGFGFRVHDTRGTAHTGGGSGLRVWVFGFSFGMGARNAECLYLLTLATGSHAHAPLATY